MSASVKTKKEEPVKLPRRRIKKVVAHGGHHGGSWKVAYADFVTAMMALFLVLWLLSQADQKLKQSVANYFRSSGVFSQQAGGIMTGPKKVSQDPSSESTIEQNMFSDIANRLKGQFGSRSEFKGDKDRVKIQVTDEGLQIQIIDRADRVTFESGSAELNPTARQVLLEVAKEVSKLPNPITIGGHTDKHLFPAGSTYSNWELSADRANAARRALESGGVKPEQVRRVVGYADTELLYPNHPFAPANRRISILVLRMSKAGQPTDDKKLEAIEGKISDQMNKAEPPAAEKAGAQEKTPGAPSDAAAAAGEPGTKGQAGKAAAHSSKPTAEPTVSAKPTKR